MKSPVRRHQPKQLIKAKELLEICCDLSSHFFGAQLVEGGQRARHFHNKGRLIALTAMRDRSQIRTIGFRQQAVEGNGKRRLAQVFRLLEGDVAGKRNQKSHVEKAARILTCPTEAVQDSAQARGAPVLVEDFGQVPPCVTTMDDHRQLKGARNLKLANENLLLNFPRRMVVEIIEPDLADGKNFGLDGRLLQSVEVALFSARRFGKRLSDHRL